MVDVLSVTTGEVIRSFDMPWFAEGKRYINGWIKQNGFEFVEYRNGSIWVISKSEKTFLYKAVKHQVQYYSDHKMKLYQLWAIVNKRKIGEHTTDYVAINLGDWWRKICIRDYNRDVLGIRMF